MRSLRVICLSISVRISDVTLFGPKNRITSAKSSRKSPSKKFFRLAAKFRTTVDRRGWIPADNLVDVVETQRGSDVALTQLSSLSM